MRRATEQNINTADYWDDAYRAERRGAPKQRVDGVRLGQLARWVHAREEEVQRSARVLDFGCGTGEALFHLWAGRSDRVVVGVDVSLEATRAAEAERYSLGAHDAVFYRGDENVLRGLVSGTEVYPQQRFDVVWCGETIEHVENPEHLIRAFSALLDPGGFLVLSTPFKGRNRSFEHVYEFTPADVCAWAEMVGELVFLDCRLLPSWLTMFAVIRKGTAT